MDILAKNLLILASAGSGKTFQLGNRIIGLVASGADPERIVALTFTRKAAGEFADALLTKLAHAASHAPAAADLRRDLSLPDADFGDALARVVRALPRLTLGTMDGFFAKVIRGFQYEMGLTGGTFDLLEGPRAAALTESLLAGLLAQSDALDGGHEFFHAFRRATIGREDRGVAKALREFITRWHGRWRDGRDLQWGPATMVNVDLNAWAKQKDDLVRQVLAHLGDITYTRKGQREALEKAITQLGNHVIGGGSLGSSTSALLISILDAVVTPNKPIIVKFYKEFTINGPSGDALRTLVELAAHCECAAALQRTRAVRDLVSAYDTLCAKPLRSKGLLGFDDVKILMGEWAHNEDARLRREAVDFRLDARIDHWLLDEFQDTSRADWCGLLPLIDEAASADDGSIFIVGDRKQAIYAWRGGDVGLFDEVLARYGHGLETAPLTESWRSCPEVLTLVNRVCGDGATLRDLFGTTTADSWLWQDHFSAKPLTEPSKRGEARVEVVGGWDERLDRLAEILEEMGVGKRSLTCGVLLRGNEKVKEVADVLRAHGFDVIAEGSREPAKDNPVGITLANLLAWLANPADLFAREVLEMSFLADVLTAMHGSSWLLIWEKLTESVAKVGFAAMMGEVINGCWPTWSDFGRRRAGDILDALAALDAQGTPSPRDAADWIGRLEISQNPGVAAVQVMTIHKAKGLGFDVVVLPEIPDTPIPQSQYFDVAEGPGWLTQTPPKWARSIVPDLRDAETRWASRQQYEAFCMLYVALTRAKRALVVLLQPPGASADANKPSLANWMLCSLGGAGLTGVIYQAGASDWVNQVPMLKSGCLAEASRALGAAVPRRVQATPSAVTERSAHAPLAGARQWGTEIHALLEQVAWVDDAPPVLPASEAGTVVARLLDNPALHDVFFRGGRPIELFREQPANALLDGQCFAGVIDRLHLHRDPAGTVTRVEIIDFKTDALSDPAELRARYAGQMTAYRRVLEKIYPQAEVSVALLAVGHGAVVMI